MKEEIKNIRNQFRSLKISLRDLYMKNNLSVKITIDIKDFIKRVDELGEKFEESIPPGLKEKQQPINEKSNRIIGKRVILNSKKGSKIDKDHICSECKLTRKPVYMYSESNLGIVFICNECKGKVFNRSFGSIGPKGENMIGKAIKSGGSWESNRRKH